MKIILLFAGTENLFNFSRAFAPVLHIVFARATITEKMRPFSTWINNFSTTDYMWAGAAYVDMQPGERISLGRMANFVPYIFRINR